MKLLPSLLEHSTYIHKEYYILQYVFNQAKKRAGIAAFRCISIYFASDCFYIYSLYICIQWTTPQRRSHYRRGGNQGGSSIIKQGCGTLDKNRSCPLYSPSSIQIRPLMTPHTICPACRTTAPAFPASRCINYIPLMVLYQQQGLKEQI